MDNMNNMNNKIYKYVTPGTTEKTYKKGYNMIKYRMRSNKYPIIGDILCNREAIKIILTDWYSRAVDKP